MDRLTAIFHKALSIMFVENPLSTAMGTFTGIALEGLLSMLSPALKQISFLDFEALKTWHYIALGILGFNAPPYLNRHKVKDKTTNAIDAIEEMKRKGQISEAEAKLRFRQLTLQIVDDCRIQPLQQSDTTTNTSEPQS